MMCSKSGEPAQTMVPLQLTIKSSKHEVDDVKIHDLKENLQLTKVLRRTSGRGLRMCHPCIISQGAGAVDSFPFEFKVEGVDSMESYIQGTCVCVCVCVCVCTCTRMFVCARVFAHAV